MHDVYVCICVNKRYVCMYMYVCMHVHTLHIHVCIYHMLHVYTLLYLASSVIVGLCFGLFHCCLHRCVSHTLNISLAINYGIQYDYSQQSYNGVQTFINIPLSCDTHLGKLTQFDVVLRQNSSTGECMY